VSDLQPCSVWDLSGWIADLSSSSFFTCLVLYGHTLILQRMQLFDAMPYLLLSSETLNTVSPSFNVIMATILDITM
jgi:hypothetical protein